MANSISFPFWIRFLGFLCIILSIVAYINTFVYHTPIQILWLCYTGLFLMGLGIVLKNKMLITSQLYILMIPDFIWVLDFFVRLVSGSSFLGIADYFFLPGHWLNKLITAQHFFVIPLMVVALRYLPRKRNDGLLVSLVQMIIFYFAVILSDDPSSNVNCVFAPCGTIYLPGPYILWWFGLSFLMIFITRIIYTKLVSPSLPR